MSHTRTTLDLIRELETEAALCTGVALAVSFEHTTLFVFSGADDALRRLNEMIHQGGEPIGFVAYDSDRKGHLTVACRPLEEYADDPCAMEYLEGLTQNFVSLLKGRAASMS